MTCPLDLIFDNINQRCEWISPQFRMSSLKASQNLNELLQKQQQQKNEKNLNSIDLNELNESLEKSLVEENVVKLSNQTVVQQN